jgi:hypothetical protein
MATAVLIPLDPDVSARLFAMAKELHRPPDEIVAMVFISHSRGFHGFWPPDQDLPLPELHFRVLADTRSPLSSHPLYVLIIEPSEEESLFARVLVDKSAVTAFSLNFNRGLDKVMQFFDFEKRGKWLWELKRQSDEPPVAKKPRPRGIGAFASGHSDTSERAREVFGEALEERYPRSEPSP